MSTLSDMQSQLLEVFFEESFENLERLETDLLALERGERPVGVVGDIFRAAHSIKGGAGAFGFESISALGHEMETLLEELRSDRRSLTPDLTALLLEGVDGLRKMFEVARAGSTPRLPEALRMRLRAAVAAPPPPPAKAPKQAPTTSAHKIVFEPERHLMRAGNDPVRILRELGTLGSTTVSADLSDLPAWDELVPEDCYLRWTVLLEGAVTRAQIAEIFSWVEGDCALTITQAGLARGPALPAAPNGRAPEDELRPADQGLASVRVGIDKIDALMNMVGELVITQSVLGEIDGDGELDVGRVARIREGLAQLARNTRALQENVMRLRSVPVSVLFNRFPRLVRDLCRQLGKEVDLEIAGEGTELDKTVLEKIGDPLVHLVRNCLDHGLEPPAERVASGKSATGRLRLAAYHRGGEIVIEVADDGRGLDLQKIARRAREKGLLQTNETPSDAQLRAMIFAPGFSTAEAITDISGRGVGLDVVMRNVRSIGGEIAVESSQGTGTCVRMRLPVTVAIIDGQLARVGLCTYVIPLLSIVESLEMERPRVSRLPGGRDVYRLRHDIVPIADLASVLGLDGGSPCGGRGTQLVIVESEGRRLGLVVDELHAQQQVVVKGLEKNYGHVDGLSGATILGDGNVGFILDVPALVKMAQGTRSPVKVEGAPQAARAAHR